MMPLLLLCLLLMIDSVTFNVIQQCHAPERAMHQNPSSVKPSQSGVIYVRSSFFWCFRNLIGLNNSMYSTILDLTWPGQMILPEISNSYDTTHDTNTIQIPACLAVCCQVKTSRTVSMFDAIHHWGVFWQDIRRSSWNLP